MTREYEYLFKALQQTRKIYKYIHRLNMSSPISTRASATILRFASTSNDSFLLNKSLKKIENALEAIVNLIALQEENLGLALRDNVQIAVLRQAEKERRRVEITEPFQANCKIIEEEFLKPDPSDNLRLLRAIIEILNDHPIMLEYEYPAVITNNGMTWTCSSLRERLNLMINNRDEFALTDILDGHIVELFKDQIINSLIMDIAKQGLDLDVNNCRYLQDANREFWVDPILLRNNTVRNSLESDRARGVRHILLKKITGAISAEKAAIENTREASNSSKRSLSVH